MACNSHLSFMEGIGHTVLVSTTLLQENMGTNQ